MIKLSEKQRTVFSEVDFSSLIKYKRFNKRKMHHAGSSSIIHLLSAIEIGQALKQMTLKA